VNLFVGCDKRSEFQGGVPARAIFEVRGRPRGSQISAPAHREPCSARLSHPTAKNSQPRSETRHEFRHPAIPKVLATFATAK
jgi:hypothetical protein